MFIAIANAIGSIRSLNGYVLSLITAFKERVYADNGKFESDDCLVAQLQELQDANVLDSASLFITPNAVNVSKVYSIIPSDGSGDQVFTRTTGSTRTDSTGLVEVPVTNLCLQSETFSSVTWVKTSSSVTANTTTAPNGTLTADTLTGNGSINNHDVRQNISVVAASTYAISIYAKKDTNNFIQLVGANGFFGTNVWANFDLNSGVVGSIGTSTTASIENVGNGWYRCVMVGTATNAGSLSSTIFAIIPAIDTPRFQTNTLSTSVFLWGAQVEQSIVAKEYLPTVAATRTKFEGITQDGSNANNLARLDYTGGGCPKILIEPARTNLVLRSEEFDSASWVKQSSDITKNFAISPDGTMDADLCYPTSAGTFRGFRQASASSTGLRAKSIFAKQSGKSKFYIRFDDASYVTFNLANGTILDNTTAYTPKIENYGNGWYRCTAVNNVVTSTSSMYIGLIDTTYPSVTPNGTDGVIFWGAQDEAGINSTSYIPTTSATVTRNIDTFSKTGISSLIGQTDGTLYFDIKGFADGNAAQQFITVSDGTTTNQIGILYNITSGLITGYIRVNSVTGGVSSAILKTVPTKAVLKYSGNNYKFFINGVLIGSDTTASSFSSPLSVLRNGQGTGASNFTGEIKAIGIWETALTDQECIDLTTP
jgi:hypothetical protein